MTPREHLHSSRELLELASSEAFRAETSPTIGLEPIDVAIRATTDALADLVAVRRSVLLELESSTPTTYTGPPRMKSIRSPKRGGK